VIAACRAANVHRLVHFSSIEALDPFPLDSLIDEERPLVNSHSRLPYASSKAEGERTVWSAVNEGLDAVVLRPTAMVGPFDYRPSLLGRAIIAIARGAIPALVHGGFDWVDVRDVAEAAVLAAEKAKSGARYILSGRWASLADLATFVGEAVGIRPPRLIVPRAAAKAWAPVSTAFCRATGRIPLFTRYTLETLQDDRIVSHAAAGRDLGYRPRDLRETIRDACGWFAENGFFDGAGAR
jgi:dihydroflavonol-4-reductase